MLIDEWNKLRTHLESLMAWKSPEQCAAIEECMRVVGEYAERDAKASGQPDYSRVTATDGLGNVTTYKVGVAVADQPVDWPSENDCKLLLAASCEKAICRKFIVSINAAKAALRKRESAQPDGKACFEAFEAVAERMLPSDSRGVYYFGDVVAPLEFWEEAWNAAMATKRESSEPTEEMQDLIYKNETLILENHRLADFLCFVKQEYPDVYPAYKTALSKLSEIRAQERNEIEDGKPNA